MDFETVSADDFGRSLKGLGLNILVRDMKTQIAFLETVFEMTAHRVSDDFAIMCYRDQVFQLHADSTYGNNPLLTLLPENPPRGTGIEIRLYDSNPEQCVARAETFGATVLQPPTDKPHGLRETYILDDNGYAWVASRAIY